MEEIELKETKLEQSRSSSTSSDNLKNIQSTGELSHSERSRIPPKDEIDEHQLTVLQVAERYYSSVDEQTPLNSKGLDEERVLKNIELFGSNSLSPPVQPNPFLQFIKHLTSLFNLLLIVAGILSFVLYGIDSNDSTNLFLGAILIIVATLNALIEFYQEYKTASILQSFMNLIPANSKVIRNGVIQEVSSTSLVCGDVVQIRAGEKIAADLRLFYTNELKIDNSSITGESEPVEKSTIKGNNNPMEAKNLAFNGNLVVGGEGYGIVIRTGDNTALGQIAKLTVGETKRTSQLTKEIERFVKKMAAIAIVTALVFFIAGIIIGYSIGTNFAFAVGIFVAFVPQGLPATVTLLLSIAAKRLATLNVLVKDLPGVETLGSITLLATDKTGTLTQNKMTAVGCWINNGFYAITGHYDDNEYQEDHDVVTEDLDNIKGLIGMCALCSKSYFDPADSNLPLDERKIVGDATETGLLKFAASYEPKIQQIIDDHPKVCEVPFSSQTKWHLTIHKMKHANGNYVIYLKGAPERVVKMCNRMRVGSKTVPWTEDCTSDFNGAYKKFASQGQRVLAFARYELPGSEYPEGFEFVKDPLNFPQSDFEFLSLVSLMDPPKRGVRKAIAAFRTAGIQVVMVTGDHPLTAEAIARKIGLITGDTAADAAVKLQKPIQQVTEDEYDAIVVHGDRLDTFTDKDWDICLSKKEIVFARTSPRHKVIIVTKSQKKGHIVGVSGDGVNDSPALKKADLGISMNKSASDVSKDAAAMILLDDNFASIVVGIHEGRLIFANLKKSIRYTLTHIVAEIVPFLIFILIGLPLAISSLLILIIDLGTELGPAISYAWQGPENDLMLVPPRKVLTTEKSLTVNANVESGSVEPQRPKTLIARLVHKLRQAISANETGEVLVDNELLLWAYLQGGLIICLASFGAYLTVMAIENVPFRFLNGTAQDYFTIDGVLDIPLTNGEIATPTDQVRILRTAQSAYFLSIVIGQWFTLYLTKHRYEYPVGMDLFTNRASWIGWAFGLFVSVCCVYIPFIQNILSTEPVGILPILSPVVGGVFLFFYEFGRRYFMRKGFFGGVPKRNANLLELVRTTSTY